jgi:hypothetical protein
VLVAVPLAWKWQLGAPRVTAVVCMVAAVVGVAVAVIGNATNLGLPLSAVVVWTLPVTAAAGITAYRFYRDPDRLPPTREDVSSALRTDRSLYVHMTGGELTVAAKNGRCYRLEELTKTTLHSADATVVGIRLNFSRCPCEPIAGRIMLEALLSGKTALRRSWPRSLPRRRVIGL